MPFRHHVKTPTTRNIIFNSFEANEELVARLDYCGVPSPWGYNFCGGNYISSPPSNFCSYFNCIASFWKSTNGYVEQCADGMFSHSGGRQGSCSSHGGNRQPLYGP